MEKNDRSGKPYNAQPTAKINKVERSRIDILISVFNPSRPHLMSQTFLSKRFST